jgi:hypothetical protein
MATFHPFLDAENAKIPELAAGDYRLTTTIGNIQEDRLIAGPTLDTDNIDDIVTVLILIGVNFDSLGPFSVEGGRPGRAAWIALEPILAITLQIVHAINDAAGQDFLLDLRSAVGMLQGLVRSGEAGCLLQVAPPFAAK